MNHRLLQPSDVSALSRNKNEAAFWDHEANRSKTFRSRFYTCVNDTLWREMLRLAGDISGKKVLFVGCGTAAVCTRDLASRGAEVWCLDISPRSLERLMEFPFGKQRERIHTIVASAEDTGFEDNSFDIVIGKAIVHHLDVPRFLREMHRILRDHARMVFSEPLAGNPMIGLFRRITPSMRVASEHPLRKRDLDDVENLCGPTQKRYLFLFALIAVPFFYVSMNRIARALFRAGNAFDRAVFHLFPPLRRLAWNVTFRCDLDK